jgi:hypothetical protein
MAEATMAKGEEAQEQQAGPVPQPTEAESIPDVPLPGEQGKSKARTTAGHGRRLHRPSGPTGRGGGTAAVPLQRRVSRARLQSYYNGDTSFGSLNKKSDDLEITVEFRAKVECSGQDLTDCRNAWQSLPPLRPIPSPEPVVQDEGRTAGPAGTDLAPPAEPGQT